MIRLKKCVLKDKINLGSGPSFQLNPKDRQQQHLIAALELDEATSTVHLTTTGKCRLSENKPGKFRFFAAQVAYVEEDLEAKKVEPKAAKVPVVQA